MWLESTLLHKDRGVKLYRDDSVLYRQCNGSQGESVIQIVTLHIPDIESDLARAVPPFCYYDWFIGFSNRIMEINSNYLSTKKENTHIAILGDLSNN